MAVELDPLAVETYQSNHGRVRVWAQDICLLSVAEVKRKLKLRPGQLDLLAGLSARPRFFHNDDAEWAARHERFPERPGL